jgi:uncharacterized protein
MLMTRVTGSDQAINQVSVPGGTGEGLGRGLQPVTQASRVQSVDTLRGVAILGILMMNILAFALPSVSYLNPMEPTATEFSGEFTGLNQLVWYIQYFIFDMKFITTFSMLFGAGVIFMHNRASAAQGAKASFAKVYYSRLGWLLLFGILHAYLLWYGDILFSYALCGLLLYPARRLKPATLALIGVVLLLIGTLLVSGLGVGLGYLNDQAAQGRAAIAAEQTPTEMQSSLMKNIPERGISWIETENSVQEEVQSMQGSYLEVIKKNAGQTLVMQLFLFPLMTFWRCAGLMFIGMALAKIGFFSATLSSKVYTMAIVLGAIISVPLMWVGANSLIENQFEMTRYFLIDGQYNSIASIFVAIAYAAIVMRAVQLGVLESLRARLAAVGQMAFTNYLMQTVICCTIFYGWGLGYFANFERQVLPLFVLGVWALQLILSPIIIKRYGAGPIERVWRWLTYGAKSRQSA